MNLAFASLEADVSRNEARVRASAERAPVREPERRLEPPSKRRRWVVLGLVLAFTCTEVRAEEPEGTARPRFPTRCILLAVLARLNLVSRDDVEVPRVFFESTTPLSQFQEATARQWGFTPAVFTNAYVATRNEIYLVDAAHAYAPHRGSIDDSLAHELTHYVQTKYLEMTLDEDPSVEFQAVDVQRWFRETHVRGSPPHDPCRLAPQIMASM